MNIQTCILLIVLAVLVIIIAARRRARRSEWEQKQQDGFVSDVTSDWRPSSIEVIGQDAYYAKMAAALHLEDMGSSDGELGTCGAEEAAAVSDGAARGFGVGGFERGADLGVLGFDGDGMSHGSNCLDLDSDGMDLDDLDRDLGFGGDGLGHDRDGMNLDDLDSDGMDLDDLDNDGMGDDLDLETGDEWDREEAVAAAQDNLRIMREEDRNYALDAIEAEILNLDHKPTEDELVAIADAAADAYDMSEDYQDY